jgi:hypothetical protein
VSWDIRLNDYLLSYLDEGISPVTADEVRARVCEPELRTSRSRSTRRNSLVMSIGFAMLLAVGVVATVYSAGSQRTPTVVAGHAFTVWLAPERHATSTQLDAASSILVRRLSLLGETGVRSKVSGGDVVLTANAGAQTLRSNLASVLAPGDMLFRQVLCAGPVYRPSTIGVTGSPASEGLPTSCPRRYQLTATNLDVNTNTGVPRHSVPPWPALANYPSTSSANDQPSGTVLLTTSLSSGFDGERLLLGPAALSSQDVMFASVAFDPPNFVVNIDLTPSGVQKWDAFAHEQFHGYIAFDFDGSVISAPITEPSQTAFSSFDGKIQLSGGLTKATAEHLVVYLESGPLQVALRTAKTETAAQPASSG